MTTPTISQRFVAALAAAVHEARAALGLPVWDEPGIAAAIRRIEHANPAQLLIAFGRGCQDTANETPAALVHANNRAWESEQFVACRVHPDNRAHTPDGECANCRSDRMGTDGQPQPLRRRGVPPAPEVRAQLLADIGRTDPERSPAETTPEAATA